MKKSGFTLIEIMIVVAIIGILVSVTLKRITEHTEAVQTYTCTLYSDAGQVLMTYEGCRETGISNTFIYHGRRITISDTMKWTWVAEERSIR